MHSNRMNALIGVTRGVVCAAICTLVGMLIMGVAAGYTGITDSTIQVLNQVLKLTSAIAGAFVAIKPGGDKGLIKGALVGAAYMVIGLASVGALIETGLNWQNVLAEIAVSTAVGAAAGVLTANLPARKRKAAKSE